MEDWDSARGAVAAMAGATFATWFYFILPMGAENDGIFGARAGRTKHSKVLELVALFAFGGIPERPGGKGF